MSMLAERKQKQKWTLNPRGKYWSDDSNKFGQRMLEKMGWLAGKGLGAKEDGITEHIKQSYKNDTKGVGFEDREDQWTQHESDFSTLLQSLGDTDGIEVKKPEVSLEIKSQTSRKRVHYHKFTRGKDLSRYSEKDLANIFGRKTLERKQNIEMNTNEESNSNSPESNSKEFGVITVNAGSMSDYFKTKLKTVISKATNDDQSDDERSGFGFSQATVFKTNTETKEGHTFTSKVRSMFTTSEGNNKTLSQESKPQETENESKEKSKKKKNRTKVVINECFDNMGFADYPNINKEIKGQQDSTDAGLQNDGFEDFTPEPIKKTKKRKLETIIEEPTIINESTITVNQESEETYTPVKKKIKKLKLKIINEIPIIIENDSKKKPAKRSKGIDNQACTELEADNICLETKEYEIQTVLEVKKKSKSKKKGIDNVACTELGEDNITFEDTYDKSSKKKNKIKESIICNLACTELDNKENNLVPEENADIIKTSAKNKKKRTSEAGIYNVACTEDNKNDIQELPNTEAIEMKSGKKKQKNKDDIGIFNPACTKNSNESIILEENETSVPCSTKKSKKKKSKRSGVDNIACTANSMEQNLEEAISSISNAIDDYQLELENQMNEKKVSVNREEFIPKFKSNRNFSYVRKSVKHIIKGDLRYEFEGSNLPQIPGYGVDR